MYIYIYVCINLMLVLNGYGVMAVNMGMDRSIFNVDASIIELL